MRLFQFVELSAEIGERPKRGEWGVRVVGWHRYARQPGGGCMPRLTPWRSGGIKWISRHRRPLNQQPPLWEGGSLPKATTPRGKRLTAFSVAYGSLRMQFAAHRSGQRSGARPTTFMPHPFGQPAGQPRTPSARQTAILLRIIKIHISYFLIHSIEINTA